MQRRTLSSIVICLGSLAAAACGRKPVDHHTHYYIFPDRSGSIAAAQAAQWLEAAAKFDANLRAGDAVTIIPIHANTASAPVLFERETDAADEDAGFDESQTSVAALTDMKTGLKQTMEAVLASQGTSPQTDIFGLVDRVRPDPAGRAVVIAILSDMEQSTPELDMGSVRLLDQNIPRFIETAARRRNWTGHELAGDSVVCILPSRDGTPRRASNEPQTLKRFWAIFFEALGAKLTLFDTHI